MSSQPQLTPGQVLQDPNFQGLPVEEKRKVLFTLDPSNFGGLPTEEQNKVLGQVPVPPGSAQDPDPVTRFLNSFGSAVTAPLQLPQMIMDSSRQNDPDYQKDLIGRLQSNDPKIKQAAKDELISSIPFGSTYLKARQGDYAGTGGDITGGLVLGALMGGVGPAAESDLGQSIRAGVSKGAGDVAAGTAKAATGTGVAVGAHALGLGPFGEYMLAKPLIVKGLKQVGQGVKAGVEEGRTRYSLLKDPGDITFKNPSAAEADAFKRPGEGDFQLKSSGTGPQLTKQSDLGLKPNDVEISDQPFELTGEQEPKSVPKQQKLKMESPVDTSKVPVKPISYKDTQNPDIAKNLQVGTKRTMPDGSTQILKSVPIDDISGDPGNQIYGPIVDEYQRNGYTVHPELREGGETKYTIQEGHHRILSDVKNGKTNITTWVPLEQNP